MNIHEKYINRCILLGKNAIGSARPNPAVGCVIVCDNRIIGEGFTSPYGGPHAEVNAIKNVKARELLTQSTLYVSLEPCSHYGKTPPCADRIIEVGIPRVVIGCTDPNPMVSGSGIARLKKAGVEVISGVCEAACRMHHARFITFHEKERPYVVLKWAESSDGYLAPERRPDRNPVWITNVQSRQLVHRWRAEEQAILVGANTIRDDDPELTVRMVAGAQPERFVLSPTHDIQADAKVCNAAAPTFVIDGKTIDVTQAVAPQICTMMHQKGIISVLVEGGAQTLKTFMDSGLWDEIRRFKGDVAFNGGITAPLIDKSPYRTTRILNDTLEYYRND